MPPSDVTAAERTETAIREALADILYAEWLMAGANHDAWLSVANKAIEEVQGQLMADPDLLVDLAIEAGADIFAPVPSHEVPPAYGSNDPVVWHEAFYAGPMAEWVWKWTDEVIVACRRRSNHRSTTDPAVGRPRGL